MLRPLSPNGLLNRSSDAARSLALRGLIMTWTQVYDPLGHWWLSTLVAAIPVIVLLGALARLRLKAHWAALLGLATSLLIAIKVFHMPVAMGARAAVFGLAYGAFPI